MKEGENTRLFFDVVQGKMMETRGLVTVYILIYKNMKRISIIRVDCKTDI